LREIERKKKKVGTSNDIVEEREKELKHTYNTYREKWKRKSYRQR
jgi:hypothetical protein